MPQRHKTDGVMLLGFKNQSLPWRPKEEDKYSHRTILQTYSEKKQEELKRSDPAKKAAEAVFKEGPSTF